MNFKVILTLAFTAFSIQASTLNIQYLNKQVIGLEKVGNNKFVEISGSRLEHPRLHVAIKHNKKFTENYNVTLGKDELKLKRAPFSIVTRGRHAYIYNGRRKVKVKLNRKKDLIIKSTHAKKIFKRTLTSDVKTIAKNIDANINRKKIRTNLKTINLFCSSLSSKKVTCHLNTEVLGALRHSGKTDLEKLTEHFNELKQEMEANSSKTYDIEGYRDFLNKSEGLLVNANDIKAKNKLKELIVNERIDSYEYTAIRAQSILKFVNKLINSLA